MSKPIYLDYAAATPLDSQVLEAMQPYFSRQFYNPSATYLSARQVRQDLETARHKVASLLGTRPPEIVFTPGATEANNLAIQGLMRQYPQSEILVSAIEHESVLEPAGLFNCRQIPVSQSGSVMLDKLSDLISDNTVLVSIMMVNNELGSLQPLREASKIISQVRKRRQLKKQHLPIYLHSDAAQAGNYLDLHVSRLGIDLMSLNGGKLYGPKQSGALYIKAGTKIQPLIVGGGQEHGWRSGTENVAAIIGFAQALQNAQANRQIQARRVADLRQYFESKLLHDQPQAEINGLKANRAPHIVSVSFPGQDNERLMMQLDEAGVQCALGSACSASHQRASHVLRAIGLSDASARTTLRFSFGRFTTLGGLKKSLNLLLSLTASNR